MSELCHYGILGQKWGVRRTPEQLGHIPSSTKRAAKKDAEEFAEAKMFYGEGAGTRRKRIKEIVNQRSKDEAYKKAFDYYLENVDMAKAGAKARTTRTAKDTKKAVTKTTRGVINAYIGNIGKASAAAAAIYGIAHVTGADKIIASYASASIKNATNYVNNFIQKEAFARKYKVV